MTAWAQLILRSTLPAGTAWQHLNAQQAGSGIVMNDGFTVENVSLLSFNNFAR